MIKNLKKLRERHGLSQQALAAIINVSQQSVNIFFFFNVEPDIATLVSIANYFNTSVDYLIDNTDIDHIFQNVEPFELNSDESDLIEEYRKLNNEQKEIIKNVILNFNK